jgi:hypothetical protein
VLGWSGCLSVLGLLAPLGRQPREWVFVKRVLDGRRHLLLARGDRGVNHPTAAVNLAALVAFCTERPAARILNSADPDAPDSRTIAGIIAAHLAHEWTEVRSTRPEPRTSAISRGTRCRPLSSALPQRNGSDSSLRAATRKRPGQRSSGSSR